MKTLEAQLIEVRNEVRTWKEKYEAAQKQISNDHRWRAKLLNELDHLQRRTSGLVEDLLSNH